MGEEDVWANRRLTDAIRSHDTVLALRRLRGRDPAHQARLWEREGTGRLKRAEWLYKGQTE